MGKRKKHFGMDLSSPELRYLREQKVGSRELERGHNTAGLEEAEAIAESMAAKDAARQHAAEIESRFKSGRSTALSEAPAPPQFPVSSREYQQHHLQAEIDELEKQRRREDEARRRRPGEIVRRFREALRGEDDRGEAEDQEAQ